MANDAKVVCKNVFKNCDRAAFTKAFTLKWIELINQYEKNKGNRTSFKGKRANKKEKIIISALNLSLKY